jgi:hypothetical protein
VNDNPHHDRAILREVGVEPARYEEPLARIAEALRTKRWICDLVETIADSLPEPSSLICLRAACVLRNDLPRYLADAGRYLLPQLRARHAESNWIGRMLDQVEADHAQLEGSIDEVADLLERIGAGQARHQERVVAGYALRCFFEGLRRHIGWEQNLILPLANESLTAEDMLVIAEGIRQNRDVTPNVIAPQPHPHVE